MLQVLIGNSYSTTPVAKFRSTSYQDGADVKTVTTGWVETQMAMGQVRQIPMNNNDAQNDLQAMLNSLGAI